MGKALSQSNNNMKFLLVVALVAGVRADADAEADPQLLLGYPYALGHHALGYHPVVHTPVVKSVEVKPAEVKTPVVTYATHFPHAGVYPYALWGHGLPLTVPVAAPAEEDAPAVEAEARKKREADAKPEADPYYLYHHPLTYTLPVVKKVVKAAPVVPYASPPALYHPYSYGHFGYGYPYAYHPYVVTKPAEAAEEPAVESERKRREAEADPAVLASSPRSTTPYLQLFQQLTPSQLL